MRKIIEIKQNTKFGRWTVLEESNPRKQKSGQYLRFFKCECSCGLKKEVSFRSLRSGKSKSCGCLAREMAGRRAFIHGHSKDSFYETWRAMIRRCSEPNFTRYKNYGGRGVKVCDRWQSYENFVEDMRRPPFEGASIDRINNDGNYEKSNCKWSTKREQSINTRKKKQLGKLKQMDLHNNLIKSWDSSREAGEGLNIHYSSIQKCAGNCKGIVTAAGFRWEYENRKNPKYDKHN